MNFTSFHFVAFFFVTLLLGHLLKNRSRRIFLLLASYYFYGVFEPWYLVLILSSTLWDYFAGLGIKAYRDSLSDNGHESSRPEPDVLSRILSVIPDRVWLVSSLIFNLGLLGYFKYTNFGIEIFNDVQPFGDTIFSWPMEHILLPIGISFYTFQSLSYTIDVHRNLIEPRRNFVDFAMYVTFFPQLVAGPIVRATTFFEQLDNPLSVNRNDMIVGFTRIVTGFFRKLVMSDNLAPLVDNVFRSPEQFGTVDIWIASLAFGFQIYLDFAGYTDIARGVARLFGFEFEVNFLYPMAAKNITEHWKRWHISLTTWIRDYVYIPLGGSRVSSGRLYMNLMIIWFLTGVWHGPAYHFVMWGLWQAVMTSVHRLYSQTRLGKLLNENGGIVYAAFSMSFLYVNLIFGFILFRAQNMDIAGVMLGRLFGLADLSALISGIVRSGFNSMPHAAIYEKYAILLALYIAYDLFFDHYRMTYFQESANRWKLAGILTAMIFCIYAFSSPETASFMYFQF